MSAGFSLRVSLNALCFALFFMATVVFENPLRTKFLPLYQTTCSRYLSRVSVLVHSYSRFRDWSQKHVKKSVALVLIWMSSSELPVELGPDYMTNFSPVSERKGLKNQCNRDLFFFSLGDKVTRTCRPLAFSPLSKFFARGNMRFAPGLKLRM